MAAHRLQGWPARRDCSLLLLHRLLFGRARPAGLLLSPRPYWGKAPKQPGSMQDQGRDGGVGGGPDAREGCRAKSTGCTTRLWVSLTLVLLLLGDATGRLRPFCFPRSPVAAARCPARSARPACVSLPAPRVRGLAILPPSPAARVVSPAAAGHYKYSTLNWQRHPGGHTVHFTLVSQTVLDADPPAVDMLAAAGRAWCFLCAERVP